jgi:hypothetical protein
MVAPDRNTRVIDKAWYTPTLESRIIQARPEHVEQLEEWGFLAMDGSSLPETVAKSNGILTP